MNKNKFFVIPAVLLVFSMFFMSCGDTDKPDDKEKPILRSPVFTLHPVSLYYKAGADVAPLRAIAKDPEGRATITYQWFEAATFTNKVGTLLPGETDNIYQPVMSEGEKFFYVVATNPNNKKTRASHPSRLSFADPPPAPTAGLNVSLDQRQYVRGFGGMSNAFGHNESPGRFMELRDIDTMFGPEPEQLGLNILRICLFPRPLSQVLKGEYAPQMGNQIYCKIVDKVNKYGGYVLASPWSPPEEWKSGGSLNGGRLEPWAYNAYANYLADWCKEMDRRGAPIYAVSIQNEPTVDVTYDGCEWTGQQQLDFFLKVKRFTDDVPGYGAGKRLPSVKIMTGEPHNDVTWNNLLLNNATARDYVDIVGYHVYGSLNSRYGLALDAPNNKETWMTEHNVNSGSVATYPNDSTWDLVWKFINEVHHCIANNDSSAVVWWYAKRFYSFIGDDSSSTVNGAILPRGWAMSHYAKFASDTVRVTATQSGYPVVGTSTVDGLFWSAYLREFREGGQPAVEDPAVPMTKVMENEDSISMVFYDSRLTSQDTPLRINLPAAWGAAVSVHGIVSDSSGKRHEPILVVLNDDGKSADLTMPANAIVSVKFVKNL
jgi:O-glycosyl hydrolase